MKIQEYQKLSLQIKNLRNLLINFTFVGNI